MNVKAILQWLPVVMMFAVVIGGWYDSKNTLINLAEADGRLRDSLKEHIDTVNITIAKHDEMDLSREDKTSDAIEKLQLDKITQARIEERQKALQKDGDRREKKLNIIIDQLNKLQTRGDSYGSN